jgi:diguanylate cyclase (GGDEF)-like protein
MVVLAGVLSGTLALWHTLRVADSYDGAVKEEAKQKALAYGQTAGYFLDALGPAGFPVLQSIADKLLASGNGQQLGGAQFTNTLVSFEAWVPDETQPGGFRRIYQNDGGTPSPQQADVVRLIAESVATGEAVAVFDQDRRGQLHVALPVSVNDQTRVVAVGTLSAESEFAFFANQRQSVIRTSILLSVAIIGSVSVMGAGLAFLVSRDLTSRKRVEHKLREQARRDPLTGVLNHSAIIAEVQAFASQRGEGNRCAVAMVDVDGLKATNDTFGHQVGDEALVTIANTCLAGGAIVGRYGGDEFVVLLPGRDRAGAQHYCDVVAERLANAKQLDPISGRTVPLAATIGVAIYPQEGLLPAQLIKLADDAMYAQRRDRLAARPAPSLLRQAL